MVRSLVSRNGQPSSPTRSWRNSTGRPSSSRTSTQASASGQGDHEQGGRARERRPRRRRHTNATAGPDAERGGRPGSARSSSQSLRSVRPRRTRREATGDPVVLLVRPALSVGSRVGVMCVNSCAPCRSSARSSSQSGFAFRSVVEQADALAVVLLPPGPDVDRPPRRRTPGSRRRCGRRGRRPPRSPASRRPRRAPCAPAAWSTGPSRARRRAPRRRAARWPG